MAFKAAKKLRAGAMELAAIYGAVTPEGAAPIFKHMAETGKIKQAAMLLVLMKDRNAARVFGAMCDPLTARNHGVDATN